MMDSIGMPGSVCVCVCVWQMGQDMVTMAVRAVCAIGSNVNDDDE